MATNTSIYNAFNRMWEYTVAKVGTVAEDAENAVVQSTTALQSIGTLSDLETTNKATLVEAINELNMPLTPVPKPTLKASFIYNGSAQSVLNSANWNNYNTDAMTIQGNTLATNAGTYDVYFSLKRGYKWSDGTEKDYYTTWTINKASNVITLDKNELYITYSKGGTITINRLGTGAISYSPSSLNGINFALNGNILTIQSDQNAAQEYDATTITISVAADANYNAPADVTFALTVTSTWVWGSEVQIADGSWWEGLHTFLTENDATTIANQGWIGKTKKVTLAEPINRVTTHSIRCIDVNKDGDKTVTFQSDNLVDNPAQMQFTFGPSSVWSSSNMRAKCQEFYEASECKDYIKTVSKGTNTAYNSSSIVYTDETVFLPSIHEMGLASYSYAPTEGEYTSGVTEAYSYYSSNSSRIKYQGDSSTSTSSYWTRSRSAGGSSSVCDVYADGSGGYDYYGNTSGFAPAFVLGKTLEGNETMIPDTPSVPVASGATIPYTWAEINAITLAGRQAEFFSVGAIKTLTLTSPINGLSSGKMIVIDINKDGNNTTTFQTKNLWGVNSTFAAFGSSAVWSSSNMRTKCQNYYNVFPGKDYIKTVSKGTNTAYNSSSIVYTDETVFLPSIHEMGLASYSYAPTEGEYTSGVTEAYSYYSSNSSRIKYQGDSSTSTSSYWTRSRSAGGSGYVCRVGAGGSGYFYNYSNAGGFAPAFVIF